MKRSYWLILYWALLFLWILGAGLFMARVNGGFLTNYLSDLTFPGWFYIYIRGLSQTDNRIPRLLVVGKWFGISPERAFISILFVGIISEAMTFYWPSGIITGTFDLFDILAYTVGLVICYFLDKRGIRTRSVTST